MSRRGLSRQPLHGKPVARRENRPEVRLSEGDASPSPVRRRANMDPRTARIRSKPDGQDGFSGESEDLDSSQDSLTSDLSEEGSPGRSPVASRTRSKDSVERDLLRQRAAKTGSKPRASKDKLASVTQTKSAPTVAEPSPHIHKPTVKSAKSQSDAINPGMLCTILVTVIVVALPSLFFSTLRGDKPPTSGPPAIDSGLETYLEHVKDMKSVFPSQSKRTWQVVGAMGRALSRPSTIITQPAVLLVASVPGTHDTARCIALHIAQGFDRQPTVVQGEKLKGLDADEAKKHLDEVLHAGFSQGGKAAVVYSLQDIPIQANLIFHSYCDNTNAPYKETAIILVLQLEGPLSMDRTNLEVEGEVLDRLQAHLGRGGALDVDKVGALLSRMAGFVLVVDKSDSLPSSCSL